MRVLITGGAGFIGSHTADRLLERGHRVRVLDALVPQVHGEGAARPDYLDPRVELLSGRLEDPRAVAEALEGVEAVIHLAAAVGVGQSMYEIASYAATNLMGTAVLLQALVDRKQRLHSLTVASSMSAYGEGRYRTPAGELVSPPTRPLSQLAAGEWELHDAEGRRLEPVPTDEEKPLEPGSVYAIHKRHQEEVCLNVGGAFEIPTTALRLFNTYGPRQALSNPYTGVAAIFCCRLLRNRPPLIYEDGEQRRDFVHVTDVASAFVRACERPVPGAAINIGSGEGVTVRQVAEILARELGSPVEPEITGKYRVGDIRNCFADVSRARSLLGWEPRHTFRSGVGDLVEWVRSQEAPGDRLEAAVSELRARKLIV